MNHKDNNNTKQLKSKKRIKSNTPFPVIRPTKLRLGTIRKGQDGKLWKVDKYKSGENKDKKKWSRASRMDVRCSNYLKKSIQQNMEKYKSGNSRLKTSKQAIAVAYSMTKKKFPKCVMVNRR
jgi:hypothetical protein